MKDLQRPKPIPEVRVQNVYVDDNTVHVVLNASGNLWKNSCYYSVEFEVDGRFERALDPWADFYQDGFFIDGVYQAYHGNMGCDVIVPQKIEQTDINFHFPQFREDGSKPSPSDKKLIPAFTSIKVTRARISFLYYTDSRCKNDETKFSTVVDF